MPTLPVYDPFNTSGAWTPEKITSAAAAQAGQATEDWWMQSPEMASAMIALMGLGLSDAQARDTIKWYYDQMENDNQMAQANLAARLQEARMAASSGNAQAQIAANARLQEAQIAADNALAIATMDNETRLKIAAQEIADRVEARIAEETTRPSDWPYQIELLKNQNPATASRTGVQTALGVPAARTIYARNEPQPAAAPDPWEAFRGGQQVAGGPAPAAVVGEAGRPEIVQPTPQGVNVIPITTPATARRAQLLPRMQAGGFIPRPGAGGYAGRQAQQRLPATQPRSLNQPRTTGIRGTGSFNPNLGASGGYNQGPADAGGVWGGTRAYNAARDRVNQRYAEWDTGVTNPLQRFTKPRTAGTTPGTTGTPAAEGGLEGFTDILFDPWAAFQATSSHQ